METPIYNQDFCDDGEPGAGRNILNTLMYNSYNNVVVFVARRYGGIKMGANRFECYREAALTALKEIAPPVKKMEKRHDPTAGCDSINKCQQ